MQLWIVSMLCRIALMVTFVQVVRGKCYLYTPPESDTTHEKCFSSPLAESPHDIQVTFRDLSTSQHLNGERLVLLVHGFTNTIDDCWNRGERATIKDQLQMLEADSKVVFVDWSRGAALWGTEWEVTETFDFYNKPAANTEVVGWVMAKFFEASPHFNASSTYCIGFSLGAHVCGFFGKSLSRGKLGRITGIDPAGPKFTDREADSRLDQSDAAFVDVIHTSRLGLLKSVGHMDFYINDPSMYQGNCRTGTLPHSVKDDRAIRSRRFLFGLIAIWAISGSISFIYQEIKNQFTGGNEHSVMMSYSSNDKTVGDVVIRVAGDIGKQEYQNLQDDICSHGMAIDVFARSLRTDCAIEHCSCAALSGTKNSEVFRDELKTCKKQYNCSSNESYLVGYPAIFSASKNLSHPTRLFGHGNCKVVTPDNAWEPHRDDRVKRSSSETTFGPLCYVFTAELMTMRRNSDNESNLIIMQTPPELLDNMNPLDCPDDDIMSTIVFVSDNDTSLALTFDDLPVNNEKCLRVCTSWPFTLPKTSRVTYNGEQHFKVGANITIDALQLRIQAYLGDKRVVTNEIVVGSTNTDRRASSAGLIVGIVVATLCIVLAVLVATFVVRRRHANFQSL